MVLKQSSKDSKTIDKEPMCSVTKRVELLLEQNDADNQGNCNVSLLICSGQKKKIVKINLRGIKDSFQEIDAL